MAKQILSTKPIAVLIDAENAQLSALPDVLKKCEEFGSIALRRAYGDFSRENLKDWQDSMSRLAIQPVQQFRIINGKSLSDSALIVDAMDLLHSGRYGAFCIVSSDSDFTRLAIRMREDGLSVYGFGEDKAHGAFVSACSRFFDTKKLGAGAGPRAAKKISTSSGNEPPEEIFDRLARVIEAAGGKKTKILLTVLGQRRKKEFPEFNPKDYQYATLGKFLAAFPRRFEFSEKDGKSYVKLP